ncbi:hypothetical protein [Desulfuribacillus alkaliarsenatis]|uniref:Cell shape determination protein CcmA n=1 Tax=Desulfuribacillus alkaliarsenatis TaxID=766136 RepID=A0A1E5G2P3_9FIRM|nr:hypothetical protein [Desulfuribacillus alkaliarsenatis]OEF97157.1 hypothetical protein BHF68_06055 [Desulfuribacillus alkaliarsenatis]
MEANQRKNLHLTGDGTAAGGHYNKVKIIGEAIINGDVDCISLKTTGTCEVQGSLKTTKAKITGTTRIKGDLHAEKLKIVGDIDVDNNANVKELDIKGEIRISGNATVENANILGLLDIKGDCNTETFKVKGPFQVGGLLNAGEIDLELHSTCNVKEIGGGTIRIKRGTDMILKKMIKLLFMPKDFYQGRLVTDSIEGDDIYIEHVKAKVVRGTNIEIGPGCEIDLLEYRGTIKQHKDSANNPLQKKI